MGTILGNIREIGIFMIAAQAVMHFAPGRQYEKYIKLVAGVMILLLFVRPFLSEAEDITEEWVYETEQITRRLEEMETGQDAQSLWENAAVRDTAVQQIEEELQSRLNQLLPEEPYQVAEVEIQMEEGTGEGIGEEEWSLEKILVVMEKIVPSDEGAKGEAARSPIQIEDIVIASGTDSTEDTADAASYRQLFADALEIEESRVEVVCSGGW
ncbi:MAG: stage III sporulation protein AF [Clostridiales bacterium]|nr:stage III sporulation protein AF [Clostridiales bacterium]